jgi:hypothetical protein
MKNMLSFLFLLVLCFLVSQNLLASSSISIVHNYESKHEKQDLSFFLENSNFASNIFVEVLPNPQIKNWGIKQSEKTFSFLIGNISFSGIKSRLNNPLWTTVNPLRVFSTPKLFNSSQLPTGISDSENYSIFAKFNPIFENKLLGILNGIELSSLWTPKENGGEFLTSLILPFVTKNFKLNLSSSFASSLVEFNETSWYMTSQFFENQRLYKFLQEINFTTKNISFYSSYGLSNDVFEKYKFYTRNDATLNFNINKKIKYETEARFFYSQNDFITLNGKILKTPLSFVILPKLSFNTGTSNLIFALGYDYQLSYSDGKEKESFTEQNFQFALKLETLKWNLTSKFKYFYEEQSFEFYNSAFIHFITTEKMILSDSLWIKILLSQNTDDFEISSGSKFKGNFYTSKGLIQNEVSAKLESNLKEESINLTCKAKLSWKSLWISADFSDIEFNFAEQTEDENFKEKKGDSNKGITFSISSGFTLKY